MGLELRLIMKILGLLLLTFSTSLTPPIIAAWIMAEPTLPWLLGMLAIAVPGALLWWCNNSATGGLKARDGFLVTGLVWVFLCAAATLVFFFVLGDSLSLADIVFEAVSGLTTTGATVLTGLDDLPRSLLLYRQMLQWMGGMGLLVLATAVLPALEIGGMQLRREMAGVSVGESIALPSRFRRQARWLLRLYLALTVLCMLAYWLAGMELFDAVAHSFSTVAIGGFSTRDASIGHFQSLAVEAVCLAFMLLATINFALHFSVLHHRRLLLYIQDAEFRFFIRWLVLIGILFGGLLVLSQGWQDGSTLREGLFQAVSFATTTGFTTTETSHWPVPLVLILVLSACVGGCSGSMGGGIKSFRALIFFHHARRELLRLVHPNAIIPIKMGNQSVPSKALESLWGFLAVWMLSFLGLFAAAMATGLDAYTAFTAVASCLTNLGPGQGEVADHYGDITAATKWVLSLAMLLGRLEIFTLLVLFTPTFWRH